MNTFQRSSAWGAAMHRLLIRSASAQPTRAIRKASNDGASLPTRKMIGWHQAVSNTRANRTQSLRRGRIATCCQQCAGSFGSRGFAASSSSSPLSAVGPGVGASPGACSDSDADSDASSTSSSSQMALTEDELERHELEEHEMEEECWDEIPEDIQALVKEYADKPQTTISLQKWLQTANGEMVNETGKTPALLGRLGDRLLKERIIMHLAGFLKDELPIRLAHRIQDLDNVPMMRDMPSVQTVKGIYISSFLELLRFSPSPTTSIHVEAEFAELLQSLYLNHSNVLIQMAQGAYELREQVRQGQIDGSEEDGVVTNFEHMESCHQFLDRFYLSRVGIRVLAGQYLALRSQLLTHSSAPRPDPSQLPPRYEDYIGMICRTTSPHEVVQVAAREASRMCLRKYGDVPVVTIEGRLDMTFPYIPSHLHYILLELLKNAMRATVENHTGFDATKLPPVTVIIADGDDNEDVVIKIADQGGGIPRSQMDQIWSYLFTTAGDSVQYNQLVQMDHSHQSPIAGLGYGLPISRAYVRYFGGELDIVSMEGYGTDAFCYLARMGSKVPLPV